MEDVATGGCHCGALRYELHSPLGLIANCHCGFCRRIHGAPYTTVTFIPTDSFHWISGEPRVYRTALGNSRNFCATCAAPTCNFQPAGDFASLVLGSLDQAFQQPPWFHVNVESKLAWIDVDDGHPAFEGWPTPAKILELAGDHPGAWLPALVSNARA